MSNELVTTVWDAETNQLHRIEPERQKIASHLHQQALTGTLITAIAIKRIYDEKFYLELGCSTREEYADTMLPFSARQARKYYAVASRFDKYLGLTAGSAPLQLAENNRETVNEDSLKPGENDENRKSTSDLGRLGVEKLYDLLSLPEENLEELITTGKTTVRDLSPLTIEEITEKKSREFAKQMKEMRQQLTGKLSRLEQENLKLKSEASAAEDRMREAREMWEKGAQLESKYIGAERTLEGKRRSIARAHELLSELMREVTKIEITLEDPETEQRRCLDLIRNLEWAHSNTRAQFDILVLNANLED